MRYPQMFATKAIERKLEEGIRKGIIWHTQRSGKTALDFYNVEYLTDYFKKKSIVPKFYFIVDRFDLLIQASREFKSRGLVVYNINSRDEFAKNIKSRSVIHNSLGKPEITVVNIHRFENDPDVIQNNDYQLNIQRVFFLDEVHRSYNPKGSFLANLEQADTNAIKIGLTGTPLLGTDYNSRSLFGEYIHKYYYNASIKDGYTLRLIRGRNWNQLCTKQKKQKKVTSAAVILHDIGTKKDREDLIEDFKHGDIDFLFVFNMLLTGFDSSRLKKLYVGRVIKAHNLLQALTRVNRTYKDFKYGYVVDFADI